MLYMNDFDIEQAQRNANNPNRHYPLTTNQAVLRKATDFLAAYKEQVDANSDGWAYWKAPVAAAAKLMTMIQNPETATEATYKAAMTPIKSFYTKHGFKAGMQMPVVY
jgi:hypothetical protein